MKRILFITIALALVGCKKDWKCTTTTTGGVHASFDFRGTKAEMQQYETDNTNSIVTTECQ